MIEIRRTDASYPRPLCDLEAPPDPIWIDGDLASLCHPFRVTIVGTRRMSLYGERIACEMATACAEAGIVVVSGLAQGIDSAAHRGALDAGGATVAVLGEGISAAVADARRAQRQLIERIRERGALVSQFRPALFPRPWMFVRRNATMAALGQVLVVVEAGAVSGAHISAREARRLGRPVYAVPGPLGSSASVGTNGLIASGHVRALTSAAQLVAELGLAITPDAEPTDAIIEALAAGPLSVDEIHRAVGLASAARIARLLTLKKIALTADGRVRRV